MNGNSGGFTAIPHAVRSRLPAPRFSFPSTAGRLAAMPLLGALAGGVRVRFLANVAVGLCDPARHFGARLALGLPTDAFGFGLRFAFGGGTERVPVMPFSALQTAASHFDDSEDDDELSDDLSA